MWMEPLLKLYHEIVQIILQGLDPKAFKYQNIPLEDPGTDFDYDDNDDKDDNDDNDNNDNNDDINDEIGPRNC